MNLLKETIRVLEKNGKSTFEVKWVGSDTISFPWSVFEELANTDYDNGFGVQQVACDLVVVGNGWWLERIEYDGAEEWAFKTCPKQPEIFTGITAVTLQQANARKRAHNRLSGADTLEDLNDHRRSLEKKKAS